MLPVKGIKLMIISVLLASLLMPFTVFADDYSGSTIQGFNVSLIDVEQVLVQSGGTSGYMGKYIYEVEFILDDSYVGYINISGEIKFYPYNSSTLTTYYLPGRNYFVNGNSFKLTFQLTGDGYTADNRPSLNNTVFTYGNHNLYKHSEIDSLETIINLLTDLYNNTDTVEGLLNSQLTQLQLIAQRCNITNEHLANIENIRQYNFPIESYPFVNQFYQSGYDIIDNFDEGYYVYPLFDVPTSSVIQSNWSNGSTDLNQVLILGVSGNINDYNAFLRYFSVSNIKLNKFNLLYRKDRPSGLNQNFTIFSIEYNIQDSSVSNYATFTTLGNWHIIPIYNEYYPLNKTINISTDFALRYGLRNRLLDNLDIIANGTTQSNSASSDLQSTTSDFQTSTNQYYSIENTYNNNMNTQLQNIDTSTGLSGFGGNFLTSANWVRVQFNNLTNGNPFGSLVTYGLTLGLALLLLGKVFL